MLELLSEKDIMEQRLDKLFAMPDAVKGRYDDFEKYIEKHEMADEFLKRKQCREKKKPIEITKKDLKKTGMSGLFWRANN